MASGSRPSIWKDLARISSISSSSARIGSSGSGAGSWNPATNILLATSMGMSLAAHASANVRSLIEIGSGYSRSNHDIEYRPSATSLARVSGEIPAVSNASTIRTRWISGVG
jgi:hypothetical protein